MIHLGRVPLVGGRYFVSFWLGDQVHDSHVAENVQEARALFEVVKAQDRDGAAGIVQAERALARLEHGGEIPPEAAE